MTIVNALADQIIGLQHVGHVVEDLDEAIRGFTRLYGLPDGAVRRYPEVFDGSEPTLFAFITVGDTEFELIQPQSADAKAMLLASPRAGGGINHVAWRVRDIDACVRLLDEIGIRPGYVTPNGVVDTGRSKMVYLDPETTDGLLVELVERPEANQSLASDED